MSDVLLLFSTVDGHTRQICERMAQTLESDGLRATVQELTPGSDADLGAYDAVVIGASIRYGKHRPEVAKFIDVHRDSLESMPAAFFSVNAVARKPEKRTPETNVYVRKFLKSITWSPKHIGIFAGKIDYPRYGFFDKHIIRLIMRITKGPTDLSQSYEFTDWDEVDAFVKGIGRLTAADPEEHAAQVD